MTGEAAPASGALRDRERDTVELVDEAGRAVGTASVAGAHTAPGQRHRAFSVLLLDPAGRLLLQRRAAAKTRFPLRWANSCCGHPAPGETVTTAARRRLGEELGVTGVALHEIGVHRYRADDPASGRVEDEYDHVLVGRVAAQQRLRPDPAEVAEVWWAGAAEVAELLTDGTAACAPWLAGVVAPLRHAEPAWQAPPEPGWHA